MDTVHDYLPFNNLESSTGESEGLPTWRSLGLIYWTWLTSMITNPVETLRWRLDWSRCAVNVLRSALSTYRFGPYKSEPLCRVLARIIDSYPGSGLAYKGRFACRMMDAMLTLQAQRRLRGRSLFWTRRGYIGMGSGCFKLGDQLVIFDGDATPFLLREQTGTDDASKAVYKIVSDCYVHGWMYGTDALYQEEPRTRLFPEIRINPVTGESLSLRNFVIC